MVRAPRNLRRLAVARQTASRAAEMPAVVCAELKQHEGGGTTVFDNSGFHERMWEPDYSRPKIGFGGDQ